MLNEQTVLDALRVIIDPDLGRDIVSLGFIKDLAIRDGCVSFTVELTTPACPVRERFKTQCEEVVGALPGVRSVEVTMSARQAQRPQGAQPSSLDSVNTIIAVSACKGGVGKSTVAVLLEPTQARMESISACSSASMSFFEKPTGAGSSFGGSGGCCFSYSACSSRWAFISESVRANTFSPMRSAYSERKM